MKNVVITLFGSSIIEARRGAAVASERWYNILYRSLTDHFPETCFPIYNSAIGGQSTRECMTRFERDVVATNPDFCLVMMGANNHDCTRPQRILAEGEFETLMEQFARGLPQKTTPIGVVLNPVIDDWHFASRHPAYQELIKTYGGLNASLELERDSFRAFIRRHNWASLDLCEAFGDNPAQYILPEDGIHLNSAGHHLFAEEMFKIVAARL